MLTNILKININNLKLMPILIFSFFPYITLYSVGSDIQPWSILFISLFSLLLFLNRIRFQFIFIFLLLPCLYGLLLIPISGDLMSSARSLIGYLTIAIVPFVFVYILEKNFALFIKVLKVSVIIYFLIGLIQIIFNRYFMQFLLNRISTTVDRGVTSLAVEPTSYGIVSLFLIFIFVTLDIKEKKKYIYMLLFQTIFLAQSSMTILFLLIFCFYYFVFKVSFKVIFSSLFALLVLFVILYTIDFSSINIRVFHLLNIFLQSPSDILLLDGSVSDRGSAIFFPIKGLIDNNFLAHGFGHYADYLSKEVQKQNIFWWVSECSNRIMSYYGSILFELGFIGLLIPIAYTTIILKAFYLKLREGLLYAFFINTILFSAIPLSFPLVGIYMATLLHKVGKK